MNKFRFLLALVASTALVTGVSFAADTKSEPTKPACCAEKCDKDAKKCEQCVKDGKKCEKCCKKDEKKTEKK